MMKKEKNEKVNTSSYFSWVPGSPHGEEMEIMTYNESWVLGKYNLFLQQWLDSGKENSRTLSDSCNYHWHEFFLDAGWELRTDLGQQSSITDILPLTQ